MPQSDGHESAIPQDENGMRSEKNNAGHINTAHSHLLSLTPEGISEENWSRLTMAYTLLRQVRESWGKDPQPMEEWDDRAPRRFRCDTCGSVFLGRSHPSTEDSPIVNKSPKHCPFCTFGGTPTLVEGYDA